MIPKTISSRKRRFDPPPALLAVIWLLILAGGYVLYARQAAINLQAALHSRDAESASRHIEWPALRDSLKAVVGELMLESSKRPSASEAGNALVATLGPVVINGMIDTYVNPKGLAALLTDQNPASGPAKQVQNFDPRRVKSYQWISPFRYEIDFGQPDSEISEMAIAMELRGITWKVTEIIPRRPMAEIAATSGL